jgi:hypothetical protein
VPGTTVGVGVGAGELQTSVVVVREPAEDNPITSRVKVARTTAANFFMNFPLLEYDVFVTQYLCARHTVTAIVVAPGYAAAGDAHRRITGFQPTKIQLELPPHEPPLQVM